MAFNWEEYLILAKELIGQTSRPTAEEARLRCAISRAYYAAFCETRDYLIANERFAFVPRGRGGVHQQIRAHLEQLATVASPKRQKVLKRMAARLQDLAQKRVIADYEEYQTCTLPMAQYQLLHADEVISLLKSLPTIP